MSRSRTLPASSSSRQMMMAWKVSGLSQSPAIIASRPASMRLAMAISPSRDRSSTEPISRRYMRTGSSVRSAGSEVRVATAVARGRLDEFAAFGLLLFGGLLLGLDVVRIVALGDGDAHLGEHRVDVLDLVRGHFLGRQHGVQLGIGDEAALFGELDHPLDGGVVEIEKRSVGGLHRRCAFVFDLIFVFLRHPQAPNASPRIGSPGTRQGASFPKYAREAGPLSRQGAASGPKQPDRPQPNRSPTAS